MGKYGDEIEKVRREVENGWGEWDNDGEVNVEKVVEVVEGMEWMKKIGSLNDRVYEIEGN